MANAYSIIHNYDNQPLYSPDFNFIQAALSARQGRYDQNKAKLNSIYSQLDALQVAKGVDQKHIEERLQRIYDVTDKYGVMDLSDDNLATSIFANLGQVFDQKTKNAIVSTKRMQREDSEWEYMRVNDPDKYAELNHQYALQKSDRQGYLDSEVAGDVYRGGANFIEYVDVNRNFFNMVPEIQKMLKATYIEEGPNKGYFRDLITHEKVDPDKVASVYDMLLDDKSKRQLSINAWGTYDKVADSDLKEVWNSMRQPALDKINANISALETQLRDPRYADQKAQIQEALDYYKDNKVSYENETFEAVYNDIGREGLYTNLYNHQFKNKIVTTYSYDNIVKRELDQAHAESIKFQQKLDEFSYQKEKDAREYAIKVRKDNREQAEFDIKYGVSQGGSSSDFTPAGYVSPGDGGDPGDLTAKFNDEMRKAYTDVNSVLSEAFGHGLTNDQLQQVLGELQPGNIDPTGVSKVTINGVTKEIDMRKHYDVFQKAHNVLQKDDPLRKTMFEGVKNEVWKQVWRSQTIYTRGDDRRGLFIENYQTFIDEVDGQLQIVTRKNPDKNYHKSLLWKREQYQKDPENNKPLTRAETKTLEYYTAMGMISDTGIDDNNRKMIDSWMRQDLLAGVKTNGNLLDYEFLSNVRKNRTTMTREEFNALKAKSYKTPDELKKIQDYEKFLAEDLRKMKLFAPDSKYLGYGSSAGRPLVGGNSSQRFSDMGGIRDGDFTTRTGENNTLRNVGGNINESLNKLSFRISTSLGDTRNMAPDILEFEVKPGSKSYKDIAPLIGLSADSKDVLIVRKPTVLNSDGDPIVDEEASKDQVEVYKKYLHKDSKTGVYSTQSSIPYKIKKSVFIERGIQTFQEETRSVYDLRLGAEARKIQLGTSGSSATPSIRSEQRILAGGSLPLDNFENWVTSFTPEAQNQLRSFKSKYDAGQYLFQIEPVAGGYYPTISERNAKGDWEVIYISDSEGYGDFIKESSVKDIISSGGTNQFFKKENMFANYLQSLIAR